LTGFVKEGTVFCFFFTDVDKLKKKRTTSDNAGATRKEILTNNRFQDRGFARRLTANNGNLGELY
jgi:hypothetical protein